MNFLRRLISTDGNFSTLVARLALGVVIFPHGAEKMFPVFGGKGFGPTVQGMSQGMGIPLMFVLLAITAEFFGSIALIIGCLTRAAAAGIACVMVVAVWMVHLHSGFFMNWGSEPSKPEGFEYHILVLGLCVALMLGGGGAWSVDRLLTRKMRSEDTRFPVRT